MTLAATYLRLVDRTQPRWIVWENVPGVLSSNKGRDFGAFLGALVELGYGFAYRVLDAQFFGIPQQRRRVFVVGYLGDWRSAAAVLFEEGTAGGRSETRRTVWEEFAAKGGESSSLMTFPINTQKRLGIKRSGAGQDLECAALGSLHIR